MELVGLLPTNINLKKIKGNMSKNIELDKFYTPKKTAKKMY